MTQKEIKTPFSDLKNKTGKHKDWFAIEYIEIFCSQINPGNKHLDSSLFINDFKKSYRSLELKDRLKLIAGLIDQYLPGGYKKNLAILSPLLGEPWPFEEGMLNHGFYLYPVSQYVEMYGTEDIEASLKFIEQLTTRFTGEFAIRSIANADEKRVLKQVKLWVKHENFHIRRLASEGIRPRLPWGAKITWVHQDPKKSLPIYNQLRNDPSLYVRRSVANAMGDIIKLDEELAYKTFESWLQKKKTKDNLWVVKHAIRNAVKKKNPTYVALKKQIDSHSKLL